MQRGQHDMRPLIAVVFCSPIPGFASVLLTLQCGHQVVMKRSEFYKGGKGEKRVRCGKCPRTVLEPIK